MAEQQQQQQQSSEENPAWVLVQKKTFTKWTNSHLVKKGFPSLNTLQGLYFKLNLQAKTNLKKNNKNKR